MEGRRGAQNTAKKWHRHMMHGNESLWSFGEEKTRAIQFECGVYFTTNLPYAHVYVPLETVRALGPSSGANQAPSKDDEDHDTSYPPKESKFDDDDVLESFPGDWRISPEIIKTPPAIEVRLENGGKRVRMQTKMAVKGKTSDFWTAHVRTTLSLGSGKSFKPTRQCGMRLNHPLLIQPLNLRENLIRSRFGQSPAQFLGTLILEANKANEENLKNQGPNSGGVHWKLALYDKNSGYFSLSVDPFYFFATWIHVDDWDSYMRMLADKEETPIRRFISFKDQAACETLETILLKVGERDLKVQGGLTKEERQKLGLDPRQVLDDEATAKALRGRKLTEVLKAKRLKGLESQDKTYSFQDGSTEILVELSKAKMDAASGKRPKELGQAAVMGGLSASDIAKALGWRTTRLGSGFFSSEWLHLSAFSWGGFEDVDSKTGYSTSQNLENLVFGTSETNSLMTRYEMAWQGFLRTEQKIVDEIAEHLKEQPPALMGGLTIQCNDFSKRIRYDYFNDQTKKYDIADLKMKEMTVQQVLAEAEKNLDSSAPRTMYAMYNPRVDMSDALWQLDPKTHQNPVTTERQMVMLAHDYPSVVYSIQYTIENGFHSVLLDQVMPCATFSFYPFQRSLYHEAEAALDALVWREIRDKAYKLVKDNADKVDKILQAQFQHLNNWELGSITAEQKSMWGDLAYVAFRPKQQKSGQPFTVYNTKPHL